MLDSMVRKMFFTSIFLFVSLSLLSADNVTGKVIGVTQLGNNSTASEQQSLRLEESWGILLEKERDLLRGIEILIDIPEQTQNFPGTYAFFIYADVQPRPAFDAKSYKGNLLFFKPILNEKKLFIHIPLGTTAGFGRMPDTFIYEKALEPARFPLLFTLLPIMKGLPDAAVRSSFTVQVRPLYKNLGKIQIRLSAGDTVIPPETSRIFIDEKPLAYQPDGITLEPGIKRMRIELDGYSPFQSTVGLEKGKIAHVEAVFIKKDAEIRLNAPADARAFLDGNPVDAAKKEFTLSPGEHTLSYKIGDYQISKKLYLEPGKSYSVSLFLDILINED